MAIIDINENLPHKVSEVICIDCKHRWIAVRPTDTLLKELECPQCGIQGYVIETGEIINENKQLLLKDLCARLPYGVICELYNATCTIKEKLLYGGLSHFVDDTICVRPFLRPMSSMTEEERTNDERCRVWLGVWA